MAKYSDDAFTSYCPGIASVLVNQVGVATFESENADREYNAVWDTGATHSTITERVVEECDLKPTGMIEMTGVHGAATVPTYFVGLFLPNSVHCRTRVAQARLGDEVDILVGMDIIALGDFAVCSGQGRTSFSFRIPAGGRIDFLPPRSRPRIAATPPFGAPGRNERCPCGSGKKYKVCCGRPGRG